MITWNEFVALEPTLAEAGRALLYPIPVPVGLGFLATVRRDGGPRVHPMCPIITRDGLFCSLIPSPKRDDLHRDPRYSLHCYPPSDNEDGFCIRGRARLVDDEQAAAVEEQFWADRNLEGPPPGLEDQHVFALDIESVLLTRTTGHGDPAPQHTVWKAPRTP